MERAKAIQYLDRHQWLIKAQSEGLSHDDSLLQLPFRANCFNWVLGHVIVHRDIMLDLMNQSPVLSPEETAPYIIESEPLAAEGDAVDFERLLELSRRSQERLKDTILNISDDLLKEIHNDERGTTIQDRIEFLIWHETYHLGQLEILRQLTGIDDAII
jgi:uncharacterized damage-inducible protein DinB